MQVIRACPICGSNLMRSDDEFTRNPYLANDGWYKCSECRNRIIPIEFDSEEDHRSFLTALKQDQEDQDEQ